MNPDDPNQSNPSGTPVDQPSQDAPASVAETCATCEGPSVNGNCTNCGQLNAACTCPPAQGGPNQGGDTGAGMGEQSVPPAV